MRISDWSSDVCSSDLVQTATNESVDGVTRLVGRPFLVHILIDPGKRTQHLTPSAIETNIGSHRIHDVDSEGFSQFPGTRFKSIRLAGKRADRAEIDHIAGELTRDRKSVVEGKRLSVRVDLGGRRILKKKNNIYNTQNK